jgi:hypothetical protein
MIGIGIVIFFAVLIGGADLPVAAIHSPPDETALRLARSGAIERYPFA